MTVDQIFAELQAAHAEMMRRNNSLAAAGLRETVDEPPVVVVAENSRAVFKACPDALRLAEGIARMGRKANVWLVLTHPPDDTAPTAVNVGSSLLRTFVADGAVEFRPTGTEISR